jgi:hypothetical protein
MLPVRRNSDMNLADERASLRLEAIEYHQAVLCYGQPEMEPIVIVRFRNAFIFT